MNASFSICRIVKSLVQLCIFVSILFFSSCNGHSNLKRILHAEKILRSLEDELDRRSLSIPKEEIINISLAELCTQIKTDENVQYDLQFVIEDLQDYRILVDRRRDPHNSSEFVTKFNPIIAYIDGKDLNRGYCSALHLDGSIALFSGSSLPELIAQSTSLLREAKRESLVQERTMSKPDLDE